MKLFSNIHSRRSTAFMVLLAWLFVLASGVANACLLQVHETHLHVAAAGFPEAAQATLIVMPGHAGAVADPVDNPPLKAPCLKVCDDGSRSLPKRDSTVAQPAPGPPPVVAVLWIAVEPAVVALRQMDGMQPATPGLPIRLRYSRLTL